jgi:hypothetical protein
MVSIYSAGVGISQPSTFQEKMRGGKRQAVHVLNDLYHICYLVSISLKAFGLKVIDASLALLYTPKVLAVVIDIISLSSAKVGSIQTTYMEPLERIANYIGRCLNASPEALLGLVEKARVRLTAWMNCNRILEDVGFAGVKHALQMKKKHSYFSVPDFVSIYAFIYYYLFIFIFILLFFIFLFIFIFLLNFILFYVFFFIASF